MNQTRPNEDTTITNIKRKICSININFPRSNFKKMSNPAKTNKSSSKSHTLNQALNCIIKNSIQLFNFSYNYHPLLLQKLVLALWSRAGKAAFTLPSPDPSCRVYKAQYQVKQSWAYKNTNYLAEKKFCRTLHIKKNPPWQIGNRNR